MTRWPYEIVGTGFGLLEIAFIWLGYARASAVEEALDRGSFAPVGARLPFALVIAGALLGAAAVIVIFAH